MKGRSRFERKILGAMALVAFAPLLGALLLSGKALNDAYGVGVNERFDTQLQQSVNLYRDHIALLREHAVEGAQALAGSAALHHSLDAGDPAAIASVLQAHLDSHESVQRLRLGEVEVARPPGISPRGLRTLDLDIPVSPLEAPLPPEQPTETIEAEDPYGDDDGYGDAFAEQEQPTEGDEDDEGTVLHVTVGAPVALFERHQTAGENAAIYRRLVDEQQLISSTLRYLYMGGLLSLIIGALFLSSLYSRRVTSRLLDLVAATRRLGAGDLTVQVPSIGGDEVQELTDAFNTMVGTLRESRSRIAYLQRIGAWQEFARRLAHEIKNPLTPIQLAAQEMHRSYRGEDERFAAKLGEARDIIEEEVATLRRLVGEFSAFAKLPTAELEEHDLGDFVRDLEAALGPIAEDVFGDAQAVALEVCPPAASIPVSIDPMMLKRCVDNLARNALQALRDQQTPEGRLRISAGSDEQGPWLLVEDNGPGVSTAMAERIFDPYVTTKSDGTGLGLPIVKKVVLEHGGTIHFEVPEGGGAAFRIRLPRR